MNNKLKEGDQITIYTKTGKKHSGKYRQLRSGFVGLSDINLAIPRENIEKIILNHRGK